HHTPGTIDLEISNPALLLNEIARRYETTERILMEYVDNSLDDAEALYRQNGEAYPYPIEIELTIDFTASAITIQDNCRGMPRDVLERIVRSIGESNKRGQAWVNGRFGFGVHAFRAAAETISFQTRHAHSSFHRLSFHRDQLVGIKEAQRSDEAFPNAGGAGTIVTLGQIEREWMLGVSVESVRQEIERHFERLLQRPGLTVQVRQAGQPPQRCRPFDYAALPGTALQRELALPYQEQRYPVQVDLVITHRPQPGRTASFFARGRRIAALSEIKSFMRRSPAGAGLWGHPNLLGTIEVGEMIQPILNRDDFVRTRQRGVLYEALCELEGEIRQALQPLDRDERQSTLEQLQQTLQSALAAGSSPAARHSAPRVAFIEQNPDGARAELVDGELRINLAHPDLRGRLSLNRQGIPHLNDRLGAYLAGVLAAYAGAVDPGSALPEHSAAQLDAFIQIEAALRQGRGPAR
ncbi:MAG: ATP-binding protein, partial [Chloroflexota bacterium]